MMSSDRAFSLPVTVAKAKVLLRKPVKIISGAIGARSVGMKRSPKMGYPVQSRNTSMSYSAFTSVSQVKKAFGLRTQEGDRFIRSEERRVGKEC